MMSTVLSILLLTLGGALLGLVPRAWLRGEPPRLLVARVLIALAGFAVAAQIMGAPKWLSLLGAMLIIGGGLIRMTAR